MNRVDKVSLGEMPNLSVIKLDLIPTQTEV